MTRSSVRGARYHETARLVDRNRGIECATMCYMGVRTRKVGVRELRQNLSVYLARVKKGQALTVTEHGRAVAELRPLPTPTDALGRLVEEGRVVPARRPPSALPRPLQLQTGHAISAHLDELRDDSI